MASENRPGVEVDQEIAESSAVVATPTLMPCIIGVCYQIVEALDSDGALDSDALYSDEQYNQGSMTVAQADFPDPRDNIDELEIDEGEIQAYLYFGGTLSELARGSNGTYGQAFLKLMNLSSRAAIRSTEYDSFAFDATVGDVLTFALDVVNPVDTSQDVTVTLLGTLTADEVVEAINTAVGSDVAEVFTDDDDVFGAGAGSEFVQIASSTYGAVSSITLRAGTSALKTLFGSGFDDSVEYRVEGAGFRGQDDEDGDLTTPWIEFYQGVYTEDDVDTTFPAVGTADAIWPGLINQDDDYNAAKAGAVTYTGSSATVPLSAATSTVPGDQFWGDGTQVGSGEVIKAELSRFKLGRLSTTYSTFDDDGEPTNRVYDTVEVNTENHGTPFSPKYAYFVADGLEFGDITPVGEAATLTGSNTGLDERSAYVMSSSDITFPLSVASLTLIFQITEDGTEGSEVTYTFAGGPYANIAALVAALGAASEFDQLTVSSAGDRLLLYTTKTGADQAISIKSTGTANTALGFSTSSATEDTGKDHEFATQAVATSDTIALPMSDLSSLAFDLVVVDSKGTHTLSASGVDLSLAADLGDVIDAIAEAFGGTAGTDLTIYDGPGGSGVGGIPVATLTTSGDTDTHGTIIVTTVEGGASVSEALVAVDDGDGFRFIGFYDDTDGKWAEIDSDGGVTDFIDLAGLWTVGATTGFNLTIVGGSNALTATDLTLTTGSDIDADEMAADIASVINAAIGGGTVTCVWNDGGYFFIDTGDATSITVDVRGAGTDFTDELFGGTTDQDAIPSTWTGDTPTQPTLTIEIDYDDGVTSGTITSPATYAMAGAADPEALCELLNDDDDFTGVTDVAKRVLEWYSDDNDIVSVRSVLGGTGVSLDVAISQAGFNAMGFDVSSAINATGTASVENTDETGADALKGSTLIFQLDDNPYDYTVPFTTNSLQDAIDDINTAVDGAEDVASETSSALTLTSLLEGAASKVYIDEANSDADTVLGLTGEDTGAGRPNPDFYLDANGTAYIGPNILRNRSSGIPFSLESAYADLYLAYTALRLDVTAMAEEPSFLEFDNTTDLEDSIGPISTANPLALGAFLALANAPSNSVGAVGIDENSAAAPMGTLDGWARALDFLESREVYTLAPLTDDTYIQGLISTHAISMSLPTNRGERITFIWSEIPDRDEPATVSSGTDGQSNGTDDSFTLDVNPASDLIANGIDPSDPIEYDDQLYLQFVVTENGASELRRYSISDVNGVVLTFRTSFEDDENTDGFYTTETFDETLTGVDWTLAIRGDLLLITGTTRPDLNAIAEAAADQGEAYGSRRVYYLACNSLDTSVDGVTQNVEGYYAAAAIAGMIAEQAPQQPLTNLPIVGFSKVYGTDDMFSEDQMDTIADGGRWLLVNFGGSVVTRKQLSTSTTSIEYKECSITKAIDWMAKGLRQTNRVFIGRSVITSGFLDQLTMSNEGFLDYAEQLGVVTKAELKSLLQDTTAPDTVLVEVEVKPAYPCNKIRITVIS